MQNVFGVHVGHGSSAVARNAHAQRPRHFQRFVLQMTTQIPALDEFGDDEQPASMFAQSQQLHHIRMLQLFQSLKKKKFFSLSNRNKVQETAFTAISL